MIGTAVGISLLSLLIACWALYWSRRSAQAAERSAAAAEGVLTHKREVALRQENDHATARFDALVKEGVDRWAHDGQLLHIVRREANLTPEQIETLVMKVYATLGRPEKDARAYHQNLIRELERHPDYRS